MLGGSLVLAPRTQARGVRSGMGIEMNDLADRMNAGVGAPGTDRDDRMTGDERQRRLHGVLDRRRVRLRLPAGVLGAVIFDNGGDAAAVSGHASRADSR